jgi:hypothetical protein
VEWLLVWIIFSIPCAVIGSRKGSGLIGFFLGLILGPAGLLFAANITGKQQFCAFCLDEMPPTAVVCPHCRSGEPLHIVQENFEIISAVRERVRPSMAQIPAKPLGRVTIRLRQLRSVSAQSSKVTQIVREGCGWILKKYSARFHRQGAKRA